MSLISKNSHNENGIEKLLRTSIDWTKVQLHQCGRTQIHRKFTIHDFISIHQREFHIVNYNTMREERFNNLYENLFETYHYQAKSTD